MEKVLAFHAPILKDIQRIIGQKFKIKTDNIKPVNVTIINDSILRFQLSFMYPFSDPMKNIFLNYEIKESSPHTLYFETLTGLKGYEKSNEYHGLESETIKYIAVNIDD
ncbi:hypothetical protein HQ531_04940 [bacterium]|nr:hypothetical protein [bacterium]